MKYFWIHTQLNYGFFLFFFSVFQAQALVRDSPSLTKLANSALYPVIYVVQQFIHWLFMGYPLVAFCLFTYDKWLKVTSKSRRSTLSTLFSFFLVFYFSLLSV